jgi:hypothetical protein
VKSEDVLFRLIKKYGIRRAVVLFGAASIAAARGWDAMIGDDAYSRQGVWNWRRDLELAGIDVSVVKWSGLERKLGSDVGEGLELGKANIRRRKAAGAARVLRGKAST